MLPRGTGSPARIMCVNCNICFNNNTMRRYHVLELDTRVTSIICNWIHPQIISEDHYVCEACRDLAIRQVNDNLAEASDNQQAGPSHRGHCSVCLLCGSSILRRQSDMILQDNPSDLHLSMIEIIQSRVAPRQIMLKPFAYIHDRPSTIHKNIVLAFNHWLNVPEDKVNQVEEIIRISHTASLILDDIQDNSIFRYGLPCAHRVYGIGLSLIAVSQAMSIALEKVVALGHPMAIKIYLDSYKDSNRGQGMELYWRDNYQCPSEEEYIDMLKQKASNMFLGAVQMLQLFSDNKENFQEIATLIGVYYALRDDYCDLFDRESLKGLADHSAAEDITGDSDITDGKFTLPIIHSLQKSGDAEEIMNILKQRTSDPTLINHCTLLLEKNGGAKYTGDVLRSMENEIDTEINRLGGNPLLVLIINTLRSWKSREE